MAALLVLAGSDAAGQSGGAPAADADLVVISRTDNTQSVDAADMKLVLTKARREEHALVRRVLFITGVMRLTEPAAQVGDAPPEQTCRWTYRSFMQRQICFTSMTGLLGCTQPETIALPDAAQGGASAPAGAPQGFCNDAFRPAVNARIKLSSSLLSQGKALFAADQQAKVTPLFKAAGVAVRPDEPGK